MRVDRALGLLTLLSIAGLLVALAQAATSEIDLAEHEAYTRALRRAMELDARFDEEVASSRLGLVTHYDGLVRVWDELRLNRRALDRLPAYVPERERAALRASVEDYATALTEKRELVERFKSEQAVLRNSLRALPHNAERLVEALRATEGGAAIAVDVEGLVAGVLREVLVPSRANREAATRALARMESAPSALGPARPEQVTSVVRHARVVLERHAVVGDLVSAIMRLDVSSRAATTLRLYAGTYRSAARRTRGWWLVFFASGLAVLLFGASFVIARLQQERDREAELARLKSRFVSMTSHEFRTPLSVILSSAELLEAYGEGWPSDKRAKHLGRIQDGAHAMARMLDQVLLIGRAEAGMLEVRPGLVRLDAFAQTVVEEVRAADGAERELRVELAVPAGEVRVDERLLRHALTNLLSNAFKYSPEGSAVSLEIDANDQGISFRVRDEGIGIPADERAQLFEAFHRCSNAESVPGTGLGLAVVKRSVEAHGGTISVDSTVGRGTTFSVRVPFLGGSE